MNNPVLALMSTDSEDAFIRDIAEAYFNNPAHVRTILTEECIDSCLDAYMNAQTVELNLSDLPENQDGFTKPSRANRGRKKSDKRNKKSKADRLHGKRHGKKYLDSLPRKKHLEADNYDHPTFRVEKGKLRPIHNVKCARETAKLRDALDVSRVERLTASVLAHMSNHVFMWDEQIVWDLTEALCEEYKQVFPDDSYICVYGKHVYLYMQYMDGSIMVDERRYTLR